MMLKKLFSTMIAMSVLLTMFTVTSEASYSAAENSDEWDLTNILDEIDYDKEEFQNGESYEYNGLVLHGGAGADITEKGLIGNKNGGYIEYTPESDGVMTIVADMNAGAKLFVDASTEDRSNLVMETQEDVPKMSAEVELNANKTYFIYNGTSNPHKIKSLHFEKKELSSEPNGQYIHVSVDDVYLCLKELSDNADSFNSIFDNDFFAFLREMHEKYNAVFSLYCFNTADGWDISEVTDKFAYEFAENSDWIKFGFHAENADANYGDDDENGTYGTAKGDCPDELSASYKRFLSGIERMTGNMYESIDHIVRLGFFGGTKTNVKALQQLGITGFLGADSSTRTSYYLDDAAELYKKGVVEDEAEGLLFLASQARLESVAKSEQNNPGSVDNYLNRIENMTEPEVIEVFTHEGRLSDENVRNMTEYYLAWAKNKGYGFDYAQNVYTQYSPQEPSEEPDDETESYDLTAITEMIGYNESEFQSGTVYEYEGLKIVGNNSAARIDENGVRFTKQSAGQMYFEYVPSADGKLRVDIVAGHSGEYYSTVCIDENLGSRENTVITAKSDGGISGETDVKAGKTYYIYNITSAPTLFTSIKLFADEGFEKVSKLTMNNIYGDNMMLQRGESFTLSGKYMNIDGIEATLKNEVTGEIEQSVSAELGSGFVWTAMFRGVDNYRDTYTITITPDKGEAVSIENVLFGDVFLLGGQSNTVREVGYYKTLGIDYTETEYEAEPNIRMLDITGGRKVAGENTSELQSSVPCDEFIVSDSVNYEILPEWTEFDDELAFDNVSALAYSFVTKLYEQTNIPVGIIATGYDGTEILQWLPDSGTNFYNSRIYPFRVFNLKGILWYQGESDRNMTDPLQEYKTGLTTLIQHYRELFANEEDVPFYYVSIPRTSGSATDPQDPEIGMTANAKLALIRQAQTEVYTELASTEKHFGIVPTLDIYGNKDVDAPFNGEAENGNNRRGFHVGQKPLVAQRLANWIMRDLYGEDTDVIGPVYKSGISRDGKIILEYDCAGELRLLDPEAFTDSLSEEAFVKYGIDVSKPQEFEIAGEDGVYYRADAVICGNTVILSSDSVEEPVFFRYAQSGYEGDTYVECPNFTDNSGIPALVTSGRVEVCSDVYTTDMQLSDNGKTLVITSKEAFESAVLVRAVYRGDELSEIGFVNGISSLNAGKTEIPVEEETADGENVRYYLWTSIESMTPICRAI